MRSREYSERTERPWALNYTQIEERVGESQRKGACDGGQTDGGQTYGAIWV